jgi:hypothetical protein
MSSDPLLLQLPEQEFDALTGEAFRLYRNGDVLSLATGQFANSTLVDACFLTGEPITPDARGRAVQAILQWAAQKLHPGGAHNWTAHSWRAYNVLTSLFIQGRRVSELAELMGISEQTLYQLRPQAIGAAARILRGELANPADARGRRDCAFAARYARLSAHEQRVLRIAAIFAHPMPANLLYQMAQEAQTQNIQDCIRSLVTANLLVTNGSMTEVLAQPDMRQYLLSLSNPDERRAWNYTAGEHYRQQNHPLDAARHYRLAGAYESAAKLLVAQWHEIVDDLQIEELRACMNEFRPNEVGEATWAQLKIVAGEIAESLDDVDSALAEYQQALGATDTHTKSLAYYRRAKALELKDIDESLAHYGYGIRLLGAANPRDPLLPKMYIDLAWIFIQERQDLAKAEANLRQAQDAIAVTDRAAWADLHNAWGELCYRRGDVEEATEHHWQGWLAAKEINHVERQMKAAHNLGQLYVETGKLDKGLIYLQEGKRLASMAGNRKMEGACNKSIGGCYFWLKQYPNAVLYYRLAYDIFVEMKNQNWLASACYDLAEVHAETGNGAEGRRYFAEGLQTAQLMGGERLVKEFEELGRKYPLLGGAGLQLRERQVQILEYARERGSVTNREYQKLAGVSQKQAARDLTELVDKKLLNRVGSGRSVRYVLPEA